MSEKHNSGARTCCLLDYETTGAHTSRNDAPLSTPGACGAFPRDPEVLNFYLT